MDVPGLESVRRLPTGSAGRESAITKTGLPPRLSATSRPSSESGVRFAPLLAGFDRQVHGSVAHRLGASRVGHDDRPRPDRPDCQPPRLRRSNQYRVEGALIQRREPVLVDRLGARKEELRAASPPQRGPRRNRLTIDRPPTRARAANRVPHARSPTSEWTEFSRTESRYKAELEGVAERLTERWRPAAPRGRVADGGMIHRPAGQPVPSQRVRLLSSSAPGLLRANAARQVAKIFDG